MAYSRIFRTYYIQSFKTWKCHVLKGAMAGIHCSFNADVHLISKYSLNFIYKNLRPKSLFPEAKWSIRSNGENFILLFRNQQVLFARYKSRETNRKSTTEIHWYCKIFVKTSTRIIWEYFHFICVNIKYLEWLNEPSNQVVLIFKLNSSLRLENVSLSCDKLRLPWTGLLKYQTAWKEIPNKISLNF